MRRICLLVVCWSCAALSGAGFAQRAQSENQDSPVGDWRGTSVCQVRPSNCHDEDSFYHVRAGRKAGEFELQADKIVNGQAVTMGTSPCHFDSSKRLMCAIPGGASMEFKVHGDEMTGVMKMPDGTVWRKITLKKVRQN